MPHKDGEKTIALERYKQDYNEAPFDLQEFAEGATYVGDDKKLQAAAVSFLAAKKSFEAEMARVEVEVG